MRRPLKSRRFSWDIRAYSVSLVISSNLFSHHRLEVLIACQVRQIKDLDILAQRSILGLIPTQFILPVNFQHNPNLPEMAISGSLKESYYGPYA